MRQADQYSQEGETNWRSVPLSFSLARVKPDYSARDRLHRASQLQEKERASSHICYRKNWWYLSLGPGNLRGCIKWAFGGNAATLTSLYKCLT